MNATQYWEPIAAKAIADGECTPHSWSIEYENDGDGCMPLGWYAIALDANGFAITWPIRHEYGPFKSESEARKYAEAIQ